MIKSAGETRQGVCCRQEVSHSLEKRGWCEWDTNVGPVPYVLQFA
jgi:hypothetical protein